MSEQDFLKSKEWKTFISKLKHKVVSVSPVFKHVLSHQKIHARLID